MTLPVSLPDLLLLLPHRPPMVLVDKLLEVTDTMSAASLRIDNATIFCDKGVFTEAGLVEHAAQTAAAGMGFAAFLRKEKPLKGYLASVGNLRIVAFPRPGEAIVTKVEQVMSFGSIHMLRATVNGPEGLVADMELKVAMMA